MKASQRSYAAKRAACDYSWTWPGKLSRNQELRDLIRAMMMSIHNAIDSDRVCIFGRPNGGELEVYALDFTSEAGSFKEGTTVPLAGTITSHVFQTGKPWTGTREQACAVFSRQLLFAERFGTGCMLPLSGRNRVLGTLGLVRAEHNPYSKDELDFLTRVSSQIALAVENALAYREISESRTSSRRRKLYSKERSAPNSFRPDRRHQPRTPTRTPTRPDRRPSTPPSAGWASGKQVRTS